MKPNQHKIQHYSIRLVKERMESYAVSNLNCSIAAKAVIHKLIAYQPTEHMVVLFVNAHQTIVGSIVVGIGSQHEMKLCAKDLLRAAIVANAAGIILGHNHPSGDPTPSPQDIAFTEIVVKAAEIVGITVLDHIVTTIAGGAVSFLDAGLMPKDKGENS